MARFFKRSSKPQDFAEVQLSKPVGSGRSGSTFSAHWCGRHVAAKVVDMSSTKTETVAHDLLKELRREEQVTSNLRHPNIVQFLGSFSEPPRYCLIFEYMDGGALSNVLRAKKGPLVDFFRLAREMAEGMAYLHDNSVMHRDLKSSNVLLTADGTAKISDFGLSCVMELGRSADLTAETGTYGWMAPEVIRHEPYSSKADVYSYAVVLWELLAKDIPFRGQTPMQTAMAVAEQQMRPGLPLKTPPKIAELIEHCWNQDPSKRPEFSAIVQVLPYVKQALSKADFKNAGILYTGLRVEQMADEEWGGGSYDATTYDEAAWYGGYAQNDPDEYWRVDAEVYRIFLELAPIQQGASVELNDLPELCRRVGRALRDDHEQFRVMQELDTTNSMQILRHDFVNWLLAEMQAQEQARLASKPRPVPAATPVWEEVVQEVTEVEQMLGSQPTVFYYNAMSGESIWELPSFVRCLWNHLGAQELAEQDAQVSVGGIPAFVQSDRSGGNSGDDAREMVQLLRELFVKYDEEKGGYLDAAEFEDLCVHVGQPVNGREGLLALIREVDPFNVIVSAPGEQEQEPRVSWDGLRYYWVTNAPFQKRTRLAESLYTSWERVDVLHQRTTPVLFRHTATLQERWGHPAMEQRVVDRLNQLFSSNKLDMVQKIDLFIDVQWKQQQQHKTATADGVENRHWNLETCWRMLSQLSHPISRREHLQAAMFRLQQQFQGPTLANEGEGILSLDEAVVRAWLHYCAKKVAMRGWEELQDGEGQTYYYHEVDGTTQWDPPQLQTQMVTMLNKLGGGQSNLSADEQIARVFRQYDVDGGGEMTLDEFQHFYRALLGRGSGSSETLSDDQVRQVFSVLDTSGDGSVTLEEFQLWWKTKLQLEVKANEEDATDTREQRRRDICLKFLENADAIVHAPAPTTTGESDTVDQQMPTTEVLFESNLLPRLATLLGEFPLRGLAHRRALNDLVREPMEQLVSLERFLAWYDGFEKAEREKVELQRAKQRAQAELQAQLEAQAAARQKQRRRRKQMHTLDVMTEQAAAMTDHEAQKQREKKISVLFKTFDTDGSGLLDEQELLQLTKALGHDMDAAQVNRMIRVMDASGDGRVSLEEFLAFWKAFEHRRPAAATAAALHQDRRDAVSQLAVIAPIATMSPTHKHTGDTLTSLSVSLEMAKDRALKLTMADMRGFLTDWRDDLREKRIEHQAEIDEAERIRKWRELHAFVPTKKRVYGTKRLDVTWIEPEVVDCVAAIIVDVRHCIYPLLKPDAAQSIQALVRGHLGRKRVHTLVRKRFQKHVDPQTQLYYFIDTHTGDVRLSRPVFSTSTSAVAPLELDQCTSKSEKYQFNKRLAELQAKKRFYDSICLPSLINRSHIGIGEKNGAKAKYHHRPLLAFSAFYMYDVASHVQHRLHGNIWVPLRSPQPELVLAELIARRRRRQLMQRGGDAAASLPLHYVVRHPQFSMAVIRAFVKGYPEALVECDAFGMTPLHIAFREQRTSLELLDLLARKPRRMTGSSEARRAADTNPRKPDSQQSASVWIRQSVCGDTPLHVAMRHRASIGVLQWAVRACTAAEGSSLVTLRNKHGESAFHTCITQQQQRQIPDLPENFDFTSPRARTAVLLLFKHVDKALLCSTPTKHGDLPLHLALDAFEKLKQRAVESPKTLLVEENDTGKMAAKAVVHPACSDDCAGWLWLISLLITSYPEAVLVPKRSNGLLPVHLAIKYGLPEELSMNVFTLTIQMLMKSEQTLSAMEVESELNQKQSLLATTTIAGTGMTLLHYTLLHQPHATKLLSLLITRMPTACEMRVLSTGDLPVHTAAAAHELDMGVLRLLCEANNEGCRAHNAKRQLPLHVAITHDAKNVDKVALLLSHCQELILENAEEQRGLRALLMAAKINMPDHRVLSTLLDVAPSRKLSTATAKRSTGCSVTPLYALSLRSCAPEITSHDVASRCHDKFEGLEDEDAYFLAMAKAKLRKQHYNPTPKWTFARILELVEHNPLDEAVNQRALLATNEKLQAMIDAELQQSNASNPADGRDGYATIVDTVTLNSDLMLVRNVHHIMYEFPSNPRLQLLGQAILSKLLPSAFVRAAYKSKVDPYFNL